MAVYRRTYARYDGPLTAARWRFLVLPRYALREVLESRALLAFLVMSLLPVLMEATFVYLAHSPAARALLDMRAPNLFAIDARFFLRALSFQGFFAFIVTAWVGPVLVSPDLVNNALPLYLSRPFSRTEYVAGKAAALVTLLSLVTWVPCLVLFGLQAGLSRGGWAWANLRIAGAVVLGALLWIAVLTLLALAISAWIKWRVAATAALFGIFFVGTSLAVAWNLVLRTKWGHVLNLRYLIELVWRGLFDMLLRRAGDLPTWAAGSALTAVCLISLALLNRRLRAREVVR